MGGIRLRRVAEQIQEEISALLLKGLKDPRIGFITITGAKVSPDLRSAQVYFCTTGDEEVREQSLEGLRSAAGFIRKVLGKRLRLKNIPEIEFHYDTSLDTGDHIEQLLVGVREQEGWDDPERIRGSPEEVAKAILAGERFLITSHLNPDGDAVASTLGMGCIMKMLGKDMVMYQPDTIPKNLRFLPGIEEIQTSVEGEQFDVSLILDCSQLDRVGVLPDPADRGEIVGIDHHLTTEPLGKATYLNPKASSIGEMIFHLLEHLGLELNLDLATCLYTSILSDTGSFKYSNTSPDALRTAAEMVAVGVNPWDVALEVYESQPKERVMLLAKVLPTLELDPSGRYGYLYISNEMFEETGASQDMIDGFINYPRGIEGVEVAIQFRQAQSDTTLDQKSKIKVSFRSRGRINVTTVAKKFGGGGHANAAGCSLEGTLKEVQQQIFKSVEEALENQEVSQAKKK